MTISVISRCLVRVRHDSSWFRQGKKPCGNSSIKPALKYNRVSWSCVCIRTLIFQNFKSQSRTSKASLSKTCKQEQIEQLSVRWAADTTAGPDFTWSAPWTPAFQGDFFSLTKRLLRPAFSDYAHFPFLTFLCVFLRGEVSINPYLHVTLPILLLGYSGRFIRPIVCA
jgi:hypothetical protein